MTYTIFSFFFFICAAVTVSLIFHYRAAEDIRSHGSPEPVTDSNHYQPVFLTEKSVDELKRKVCETLALQVDHVSQILWRRKNKQQASDNSSNKSGYFVLVDDEIVAHHVQDKTTAAATWDIRSDGRVRLILEMSS